MKERILRLCKRLDKFTLDEIEMVSELKTEELMPILSELKNENRLIQKGNSYFYNKVSTTRKHYKKLPLFVQFHTKREADYILRGFCVDMEAFKMADVFSFSKQVINKYYTYFRTLIYETQKQQLLKYFEKIPKIPQERIYMNTKVYLYLYNDKLFVSEKYLVSKDTRKHREDERLQIKNIYLRSFRKVLSRSFAHKFHLHLAEELWKYNKEFDERYKGLNKLLNL